MSVLATQSLEQLPVGPFSLLEAGSVPAGWESLRFPSVGDETHYSLIDKDGRVVLRADSRMSASALVKRVAVDAAQYPYLSWSWRTGPECFSGDWRRPEVDDFPLRLFVLFESSRGVFSFFTRLGSTFSGDAILYVTRPSAGAPEDAESHVSPRIKVMPLTLANREAELWEPVVRNIRADYVALFGKEPKEVTAVAVMTDTDNSATECVSYFGDISLSRAEPREH